MKNNKKIAIIGNAGSGKTTLAFELQKKLNLPLYHLDQYAWFPNWDRVPFDDLEEKHQELCKKHEWIIEGIYLKLLPERIVHANIIIFLDIPRYHCVWRVIKRAILHWGKVIPGNPAGCKQHIFDYKFWDFLKWIWSFKNNHKAAVLELLDSSNHDSQKEIYVLRSRKQITNFCNALPFL